MAKEKDIEPTADTSNTSTATVETSIQRQFIDAYRDYLRALQDALSSVDQSKRAEDLYWNALQGIQSPAVPDDVQKRLEEIYQDYIRRVQDTWVRLDFQNVDAPTLAIIGQTMLAAAWTSVSLGIRTGRWVWNGWACVPWSA